MWQVDLTEVWAGVTGRVRRGRIALGDWAILAVGLLVLLAVFIAIQAG